ncbi:hypothetical protein ACFL5O_10065, partial [Myxococcota bacterium]
LLRAEVAGLRNNEPLARNLVVQAHQLNRRYDEDHRLLESLMRRYEPHRSPLLSWNLDVGAGWTSNGLAGSPVDRATSDHAQGSPLLTLNLRARWVPTDWRPIRPLAEVQFKATQLLATTTHELSTRQPTLRLGALWGRKTPRLLVAYGYDFVQAEGGDRYDKGPLLYSEAHRGEYELDVTDTVIAFGAVGRRFYREAGRTRLEMEQGLAKGWILSDTLRLTTGLSLRVYEARNRAYDQMGGTGLARLDITLPAGFELRETLSVSGDIYPNSEGFFDSSQLAPRRETLARVGAGLWSPPWSGLRIGTQYEHSGRDSSAGAYSYTDHRVLGQLVWNSDSDRVRVSRIASEGRVPLRHGTRDAPTDSRSKVDVRDLMQQDEALRRGSSCLK